MVQASASNCQLAQATPSNAADLLYNPSQITCLGLLQTAIHIQAQRQHDGSLMFALKSQATSSANEPI